MKLKLNLVNSKIAFKLSEVFGLVLILVLSSACTAGNNAYELRRLAGAKFQSVSLETLSQCLGTAKNLSKGADSNVCLELSYIDSKLKSEDSMSILILNGNDVVAYSSFKSIDMGKWRRSLSEEDKKSLKCYASNQNGCKSLVSNFPIASVQKFGTGGILASENVSNPPQSKSEQKVKSVLVVNRDSSGFHFRIEEAKIWNGKKGPIALLKGSETDSQALLGVAL